MFEPVLNSFVSVQYTFWNWHCSGYFVLWLCVLKIPLNVINLLVLSEGTPLVLRLTLNWFYLLLLVASVHLVVYSYTTSHVPRISQVQIGLILRFTLSYGLTDPVIYYILNIVYYLKIETGSSFRSGDFRRFY